MRAVLIAVLTVCSARNGLSQLDPSILFKGAGGVTPAQNAEIQKTQAETESIRLRNQQLQQQIQQQKSAAAAAPRQQASGQQPLGSLFPPAGPQFLTFGMGNGRMWTAMAASARLTYLSGVRDSLLFIEPPEADSFFATDFSAAEIAGSIDAFYLTPENARIPIVHALRICVLRFKGDTPEAIDVATAKARQASVSLTPYSVGRHSVPDPAPLRLFRA